jgi:transposase InsO family protein
MWLIDSGASTHMCRDRHLFTTLRQVAKSVVQFGSGKIAAITMEGDIDAQVTTDDGVFDTWLTNVLYVPSLRHNLVSALRWSTQGIASHNEGGICTLLRSEQPVGHVKAVNNLLPVSITRAHSINVAATTTPFPNTKTLWHYRAGHVNPAAMDAACGLVEGMEYSGRTIADCTACMEGKLHALPHPEAAEHRAQRPLQLIHSDICGPMTPSRDGFRYFITFIDDCTRHVVVCLLRDKSEAMQAFLDFKASAEKGTQRNVEQFRTDGGGEYLSNDFIDFLSGDGIQRQTSAPYSQQQNGVSERYNRTVMEMAQTMRLAAGLGPEFWSYAILAAVHIRNRMPTSAVPGMTPFEAFYGYKPSVDHFRVFGCIAYALVPKGLRRKLDSKARVCINLGPAPGYKAYKVLEISTGKVFVSRNVRFVEHQFRELQDNAGQGGDLDATTPATVTGVSLGPLSTPPTLPDQADPMTQGHGSSGSD